MATNGWCGTLLRVDLTTGTSLRETVPQLLLEEYLGGRGLGVRLMRDSFQLDPFDPNMPLIFAVGPLCGTTAPTSSRLSIVSKSPLTGTVYDCSAGGSFAWQLKASGLDALVITGRSPWPVILTVETDNARIVPALPLWGCDIPTTVAALKEHGSVAAIGPAGENGVLFAKVLFGDGNSDGRGGLGAVMGSKNLKAITVSGTQNTTVSEPEKFDSAYQDVMRLFKASPVVFGPLGLAEFGTPILVDVLAQRRMTPTENFRKTYFKHSDNYSGPTIKKKCGALKSGCYGCPIECIKLSDAGVDLPGYETLSHFGALNNISSLQTIIDANNICNSMGMDTITAAATLSAWGEIRGSFITTAELPGLLNDIAMREGYGVLLGLGSQRLATQLVKPELSMSVKSLELPGYDPRGAYGMALSYCTSNRGACHLSAYPISHEILRKPVPTDRFSFSGKARIISIAEDSNAAVDSLVACKSAFFGASLEEYAELLTAVTGIAYSPQRLKEIGCRIVLTERFYNCANGFTRKDDMLPERFFTEAGSSGDGIDINPVNRTRFEEELEKYYLIRGLNSNGCFDAADFLEIQP